MEVAPGALAWPDFCNKLTRRAAVAVAVVVETEVEVSVDCSGVPPSNLPVAVGSDETEKSEEVLSATPVGGEGNSEWAINLAGDRGSDSLAGCRGGS